MMSLKDIYCSGMCQVLTRFSENLATFFILSCHVSQNSNVVIRRPNILLNTYHSCLVFRRSCFKISPKRLVMLTDILPAIPWKLSYYCFRPYGKLWMFFGYNILSMCYSASRSFMHVIKKNRECLVCFQLLKKLPRKNSSQRSLV